MLNSGLVNNLSDGLFLAHAGLHGGVVSVFQDLSNYFGEYSVIKCDRDDGQNYEIETQVVINRNYPLRTLFKKHHSSWRFEGVESVTRCLSHPPPPRSSRDSNQQPSSLTSRHPTYRASRRDKFPLS